MAHTVSQAPTPKPDVVWTARPETAAVDGCPWCSRPDCAGVTREQHEDLHRRSEPAQLRPFNFYRPRVRIAASAGWSMTRTGHVYGTDEVTGQVRVQVDGSQGGYMVNCDEASLTVLGGAS